MSSALRASSQACPCAWIAVVLICPAAGLVPLLGRDLNGYLVDWGAVPAEAETRRVLSIPNIGNATVYVRWEGLVSPFSANPVEQSFTPDVDVTLSLGCFPPAAGYWSSTAVLRTNVGVIQDNSTVTDVDIGTIYRLEFRCSSNGAPGLDVEPFSGVYLHEGDGGETFLEPSVPSEWERLVVDAADVNSTLIVPSEARRLGCSSLDDENVAGHVVLLERGSCYFQSKALAVQNAGGVGVLLYDKENTTLFRQMAMAYPFSPPRIPTFLVSRKIGLELQAQLEAGSTLRVSLLCRPIVLWTLHPEKSPSHDTFGVVRVRNNGVLPASWSISPFMFDYNQNEFYTALHSGKPIPEGFSLPNPYERSPLGTVHEIPQFSGQDFDDGVAVLSLPFPFPFFGKTVEKVHVSANGLLVFATSFIPGLSPPRGIPSEFPPNGFIAPYWSDLQCRMDAGCRFLVHRVSYEASNNGCNCTEAFVIQYSNLEHKSNPLARVSVETRLCRDGCIEMRYPSFPDQADANIVSIGLESMTGRHGLDITRELASKGGQTVAAAFLPWFSPQAKTEGSLAPGETAEFTFRVAGPVSKQGWLRVFARDDTGFWRRERQLRVVHRVFKFTWHTSEWGPCQTVSSSGDLNIISGGLRQQSRSVWCMGSDGLTYDHGSCQDIAYCEDRSRDWVDSVGLSCNSYEMYSYCTKQGSPGIGWKASWGSLSEYQSQNMSALSVCCACGGGLDMRSPTSFRTCAESSTSSTTTLIIPTAGTTGTFMTAGKGSSTSSTTTEDPTGTVTTMNKESWTSSRTTDFEYSSTSSTSTAATPSEGTSVITNIEDKGSLISSTTSSIPSKETTGATSTTQTTSTRSWAASTVVAAGALSTSESVSSNALQGQVSSIASSSLVISGLLQLTPQFNRSIQIILAQTLELQLEKVEVFEIREVPTKMSACFTVSTNGTLGSSASQRTLSAKATGLEESSEALDRSGIMGLVVQIGFAVLLNVDDHGEASHRPEDGKVVQMMEAVKINPQYFANELATVLGSSHSEAIPRQLSVRFALPEIHHVQVVTGSWGPCVTERVSCELPAVALQRREIWCVGANGQAYAGMSFCNWLTHENTTQPCPSGPQSANPPCKQNLSQTSPPLSNLVVSQSTDEPLADTLEQKSPVPARNVTSRTAVDASSTGLGVVLPIVCTMVALAIVLLLAILAQRKCSGKIHPAVKTDATAQSHRQSAQSDSRCADTFANSKEDRLPENVPVTLPATVPARPPPSPVSRAPVSQLERPSQPNRWTQSLLLPPPPPPPPPPPRLHTSSLRS